MKTINTSIKKLGIFTIGQQNDNEVLDIVFDISEWRGLYPELTSYGIIITSPDNVVYPANTEVIWDELVWHVSGADTAVVGEGEYQIVAVSENGNKKHTTPQKFSIIANMPGIEDAGDAPEHIEPWYTGVVQKASEAQESARKAEEAAQRAENAGASQEAIGNAVADYLAKNPVQEKDPTVPEWAKAKEKPKYTAEEVGALPYDTVIPAPYTLPTASAEVKGGVKVGNGLQMDGDVLGVVEEEYELIEKIILEEDSTLIRNQEPDGTPYRLKAVMIKGKTKTSFPNGGEAAQYLCNGRAVGYTWMGKATITDGKERYRLDRVWQDNGYWASEWRDWVTANDGTMSSFLTRHCLTDSIKQYPYIDSIKIYAQMSAGTELEIWGVRANA